MGLELLIRRIESKSSIHSRTLLSFFRISKGLSLAFCLLLSACQFKPAEVPDVSLFKLNERDNEPVFEAFALHVGGFEGGSLFETQSKFYPKIKEKFNKTGVFELNDPESEREIIVKWEAWKRDRDYPQVKSGMKSMKWNLLEDEVQMVHRMEIQLWEKDVILKRYEYDEMVYFSGRSSFDSPNRYLSWFHEGVNPMLSQFFLDLKHDGYFLKSE